MDLPSFVDEYDLLEFEIWIVPTRSFDFIKITTSAELPFSVNEILTASLPDEETIVIYSKDSGMAVWSKIDSATGALLKKCSQEGQPLRLSDSYTPGPPRHRWLRIAAD